MATGTRAKTAQPAASKDRGEHSLELDGVTYRLRPSYEANVAIEEQTGSTLLQLVTAGDRGAISLKHLGILAAEWIKAGASPDDDGTRHVGAKAIGELIYEAGVPFVTARVTNCLLDAVTGGRTAAGEAKAIAG